MMWDISRQASHINNHILLKERSQMADDKTTAQSPETSPVVPERVERDTPPAPAKKPVAKKKVPVKKVDSKKEPPTPAALAPAAIAAETVDPPVAPKSPRKKKGKRGAKKVAAKKKVSKKVVAESEEKAVAPKGKKKKGQWRKGRVWPVQSFAMYINVQTKKPKALAVALRKTIWKFAVRTRKKGKKAE
jgi:hypothetical protein